MKLFFMVNSTEREISLLIKTKIPCFKARRCCVFILLINVTMPTIVGIVTFMRRVNFVFS